MQVSSSKGHDYSKKCKHVMTETEVPFLFIRINSRAAPFDPLHGVFQHHEFIPQNLFIKKKIMSQNKIQKYPIWKMFHCHLSLLGGSCRYLNSKVNRNQKVVGGRWLL
jgi:hypothetical protein